jgi:hypothetical protein
MIWVIDLIRSLDRVGPDGWPTCSPIWREVVIGDSAETAIDIERHVAEIAIDDMRSMCHDSFVRLQAWRAHCGDTAGMEEVFEWLAERIDTLMPQ